jgi:hypothetical protein
METMKRMNSGGMVYATNPSGWGLFVRREHDGAYTQVSANLYFPDEKSFIRHLKRAGIKPGRLIGW